MRIALVTDDGQTISRHFGRAAHFLVVTAEDGQITHRELRDKGGCGGGHGHGHPHGEGHGQGQHARHARIAETISDCEAAVTCGMGRGAYHHLQEAGIRPIITLISDIDEAVAAYLKGELQDHPEKLH